MENSAAKQAGLKSGDIIREMTVQETGQVILVSSYDDIQLTPSHLQTTASTIHVQIKVQRDQQIETVDATLQLDETSQAYKLGIYQATRSMNIAEAIQYTFISIGEMSVAIFAALSKLITRFSETVTQLSGPVGIYQVTSQVTETGQISYILNLLALLSVNVGIFNLLPIPGLDGCQVIFALVEKIIGRELPEKVKMALQLCGLGLVMLLMIFVTYQDVLRIFQ